ncbi:MAG: hypothetical protein V4564_18320 [Pseudomonadota bacterium]|uniref:hypothetical protein n=1 Tax=Sphingomonas sp. ERG5 TaxID=1381597 RepID=UPI000689AD82|nr:hypothetical protein [Sphingomonas sp. ERG5]
MATSFPVSVRLGGASHAVVVDAGFALSPMGLLVTMALARKTAVWLPRGLLTLLDNDSLYRRAPELMGGGWLPEAGREASLAAMAAELPAWQRAWHYGKLSARVHWIGDARAESTLADREDAGLLPRFEHCAAALDALFAGQGEAPVAPLDECARDAVALAAALQPDPVMLLSLPENGADDLPPLCRLLTTLGFGVRRRPAGPGDMSLLDVALVPLEAGGCGAALLQIVAPGVLSLPDGWDDAEWGITDGETLAENGDDVWRNACALWQPVAAMEAAA